LIVFVITEHFNTEIFIYKKRDTVVPNRDLKPLAAFHYSVEIAYCKKSEITAADYMRLTHRQFAFSHAERRDINSGFADGLSRSNDGFQL